MIMTFSSLVEKTLAERETVLCLGLDPAVPEQRPSETIPKTSTGSDSEQRLDFCLEMIENLADMIAAVKPNEQYLFGFTLMDHQAITRTAAKQGLVTILDCKLGDIGDTVQSKLFWIRKAGYNALTVHTQQGNLQQIVAGAHRDEPRLGIIALALMSNPEAIRYFKETTWNNLPVYKAIANDVKVYGADGVVVGATGHVTKNEISEISSIVGDDKVFLVPGIGAQGGEPAKVFDAGVRIALINVGRSIIYSDRPARAAKDYRDLLWTMKKNCNQGRITGKDRVPDKI